MDRNTHLNVNFFSICNTSPLEIENYVKRDIYQKVVSQFNFISAKNPSIKGTGWSSLHMYLLFKKLLNEWMVEKNYLWGRYCDPYLTVERIEADGSQGTSPRLQSWWKARTGLHVFPIPILYVAAKSLKNGNDAPSSVMVCVCAHAHTQCIYVILWCLFPSFCVCFLIHPALLVSKSRSLFLLVKGFMSTICL